MQNHLSVVDLQFFEIERFVLKGLVHIMEVRSMQAADLEQVAEIERLTFSKPWSYKAFEDSLALSNAIYNVAVNNNEVLGYCGLYCVLNEANITNVAVKSDVRNKGIGYGMLVSLMDEAKTRGIEAVTLEVRKSNYAAIHLYEQLGFKEAGIRKDFYELPREDAVIMWKDNL